MENAYDKNTQKDDLSYQRFGDKMISKEEYERYKNSLKLWTWRQDAENCVKGHKQELTTIIRGLKHTIDNPDEAKLSNGFINLFTRWIHQLFRKDKDEAQYNMMIMKLTQINGKVMREVSNIISDVMQEN